MVMVHCWTKLKVRWLAKIPMPAAPSLTSGQAFRALIQLNTANTSERYGVSGGLHRQMTFLPQRELLSIK